MTGNIVVKRIKDNYGRNYYKKLTSALDKVKLSNKYVLYINRDMCLPSVSKLTTMISELDGTYRSTNQIFRLDEKISNHSEEFGKYKYGVTSDKWDNKAYGVWLVRNEHTLCNSGIEVAKFKHRFFCKMKRLKGFSFMYFIIVVAITILLLVILHCYRKRRVDNIIASKEYC